MCDFGIVSGPLIAGGLASAGLASSATAAASTAGAIATALSTAAYAAAGTAATSYAQQQQGKANAATAEQAYQNDQADAQAERTRQQGYQQQKEDTFGGALKAASPDAFNAEYQKERDALTGTYSAPADAALNSFIPGIVKNDQSTGERVVQDSYKNKLSGASDFLKGQAGARAGMDAFTGTIGKIGMGTRDSIFDLNLLNNFAGGSKNILPIEQGVNANIANTQFQNNQTVGEGAATLGNLLTSVGVTGGLLSAGKNASVPSVIPGTYSSKSKARAAAPYNGGIASLGSSSYVPRAAAA